MLGISEIDSRYLLLKETGGQRSFEAHQVSSSCPRKALALSHVG